MSVQKAQWTILTYIAAHNNLEALGQRSLEQILSVGSTPQLKLATLYDRHNGATRYIAGKPGQAAVEEPLNHIDSGDPDVLLETARWVFDLCPAERYALVLWSHGSGWQPEDRERSAGIQIFSGWTPEEMARIAQQVRGDSDVSKDETTERSQQPGSMAIFRTTLAEILKKDPPAERAICFDDGSGHSLDTLELERVAGEIHEMIGQPLDLLGMDACVMATLEVAYQVRQYVRYLVASEELVPGRSWPYDTILGKLHSAPEKDLRDLSALIVQQYVDYYTQNQPSLNYGDVTKVALDLRRINELVQPVHELSKALLLDDILSLTPISVMVNRHFEERGSLLPMFWTRSQAVWHGIRLLKNGITTSPKKPSQKLSGSLTRLSLSILTIMSRNLPPHEYS